MNYYWDTSTCLACPGGGTTTITGAKQLSDCLRGCSTPAPPTSRRWHSMQAMILPRHGTAGTEPGGPAAHPSAGSGSRQQHAEAWHTLEGPVWPDQRSHSRVQPLTQSPRIGRCPAVPYEYCIDSITSQIEPNLVSFPAGEGTDLTAPFSIKLTSRRSVTGCYLGDVIANATNLVGDDNVVW